MTVVEHERVEELTAPREVTEADVLERAADLLEEFGWCQGLLAKDAQGFLADVGGADSFCVMGAIRQGYADLTGSEGGFTATIPPFQPWMRLPHGAYVATWNDTPGRTKEEVVSALRTAAEKARES